MRLFISYARVDKPVCLQIVDMLDVHEVWFDQRLRAGQQWWDEILHQLDWCHGYVYLLSPDSVKSEYCQREFTIAKSLGKHIFPVLIHRSTQIPELLKNIQYADLSNGMDVHAVKNLLNAITLAEREYAPVRPSVRVANLPVAEAPHSDPATVFDEAAEALETGDYDRAVFLLKQAQEKGLESRFIDLKAVLAKAEAELERQARLREAEREYRPIVALVKRAATRNMGSEAFQTFRQHFPDYDPDGLAAVVATVFMPMLEWCEIPAGNVTVEHDNKSKNYYVDTFRVSKYPITNAQYRMFITAADGYKDERWWEFSPHALNWLRSNPEPNEGKYQGDDQPRENICWYAAMAFTRWLSHKTGLTVTLPTEQQWQRASQGDDARIYPWGNKFDASRCNSREGRQRTTTPVAKYTKGVSPYGVFDMSGNVWEWCLNTVHGGDHRLNGDVTRAVRGGSFISAYHRTRTTFNFYLSPVYRYATIGFRVICSM